MFIFSPDFIIQNIYKYISISYTMIMDISDIGNSTNKGNLGPIEVYIDIYRTLSKFILYHGTSDMFLDEILDQGLKPRKYTGNSVYNIGLKSDPKKIYFSYGFTAGGMARNAVNKFGGKSLVVRVLLDTAYLTVDEDHEVDTWEESLAKSCGSCAVKGIIATCNILGYYNNELNTEAQDLQKKGISFLEKYHHYYHVINRDPPERISLLEWNQLHQGIIPPDRLHDYRDYWLGERWKRKGIVEKIRGLIDLVTT